MSDNNKGMIGTPRRPSFGKTLLNFLFNNDDWETTQHNIVAHQMQEDAAEQAAKDQAWFNDQIEPSKPRESVASMGNFINNLGPDPVGQTPTTSTRAPAGQMDFDDPNRPADPAEEFGGAPVQTPQGTRYPQGHWLFNPDGTPRSYEDVAGDPRTLKAMNSPTLAARLKPIMEMWQNARPDVKLGPDGTPYNSHSMQGLPERFRNPTNINGHVVDANNPQNEGQAFYQGMQAQEITLPNGQKISVQVPQAGYNEAMTGQSAAEARGKARFDKVEVSNPDGSKDQMTGERFADLYGGANAPIRTGNDPSLVNAREGRQAAARSANIAQAPEYQALNTLTGQLGQMTNYWDKNFKGRPTTAGGYVPDPLSPTNQAFNALGNQMLPQIAHLLGFTTKQMDTPAEVERLKAYIPTPQDTDETAAIKFSNLQNMVKQRQASLERSWQEPDAYTAGNVAPQSGDPRLHIPAPTGHTGNRGSAGSAGTRPSSTELERLKQLKRLGY